MGMVHLQFYPVLPKSIRHDPIYGIVSRNTLLGVHRTVAQRSKTMLLLANQRSVATQLLRFWETMADEGKNVRRVVSADHILYIDPHAPASLRPMQLQAFDFSDLERLSHIHFFDMYIAYEFQKESADRHWLRGYEVLTTEEPPRAWTEKYLRDMLF